jgi:hypothetical protein
MKKIFSEKVVALVLIFIAFVVAYYFYQEGKISFLPWKKDTGGIQSKIIEVPFTEKEYKLSYKDKLDSTFDIANFEDEEDWGGDGEFDYSTFLEGESSLFLTSFDGQKARASLKKNFDISNVFNFKFFIYLATEPDNIEELNLIFTGKNLEYKFPVRDLGRGWNLLILPKERFSIKGGENNFSFIEKTSIELVSRPKTRSTINLDSLWAEKEADYLKDWNSNSDKFLSLRKRGNFVGLLMVYLFDSRAVLNKGSAKNYTFQAKFMPLRSGNFGFFLRGDYKSGYGYYLMMDGVGSGSWRIYKYGFFEEKTQVIELAKGEISNFKIEKDQVYWLKTEIRGPRLTFYFSLDEVNFSKLGEAIDSSFSSGGVGVTISGETMVLVDDVQFFQ